MFMDELRRDAPGSVFVFEIDRRQAAADGCNWYPLASIGSWEGDITANLNAFRRIRERLSRDYVVFDAADVAGECPVATAEPVAAEA
jgi:hypothetical protein